MSVIKNRDDGLSVLAAAEETSDKTRRLLQKPQNVKPIAIQESSANLNILTPKTRYDFHFRQVKVLIIILSSGACDATQRRIGD